MKGRALRPFRHQALVDAMRIDDDPALGRLAEHFGQPNTGTAAEPMISAST
jgi:hypothetical protein